MPPFENSRHSYTIGYFDRYSASENLLFLAARIPFPFKQREDNRLHVARGGDTLYGLAGKFFAPLERACGLWWVIADYQPEPIHDPTLQLAAGRVIVIPSLRTVLEEVLDEGRAWETES